MLVLQIDQEFPSSKSGIEAVREAKEIEGYLGHQITSDVFGSDEFSLRIYLQAYEFEKEDQPLPDNARFVYIPNRIAHLYGITK